MKTNFKLLFLLFVLVVISVGCVGAPSEKVEAEKVVGQEEIAPTSTADLAPYGSESFSASRPKSWEVEEHGAFVYFKSPLGADLNDLQENVVVYVTSLGDPGQDLIHFFQDSVEALMETTPEFTIASHREDKFGDVPAYRIVYTEGEGGSQTKYLQVFAVKGGNSYIVTYTAPAETFDKYLPDAEAVISSYRIK